jgi:hypothetical protein
MVCGMRAGNNIKYINSFFLVRSDLQKLQIEAMELYR